jgi:hypothetical protein
MHLYGRDEAKRHCRKAAYSSARSAEVPFFEVPNQFVDAAKFQVSPEDQSDQLSFFFDNGDLAVFIS